MSAVLETLPDSIKTRDRLVGEAQVRGMLNGRSRAQLHRDVRSGKFPRPFKIGGRKNFWRLGKVLDHLAKLEAAAL